jgi:hypothetical protein
MNIEVPSDQPDPARNPGDNIADAAERELMELRITPSSAAGAPPLAADLAPAAAPETSVAVGGEFAGHEKIRQDELSPDDVRNDEMALCNEIAADDPCEHATHAAAAALGDASQVNLRRLEMALSEFQSEVDACRLPPTARLPPVPGLPAIEPVIDRRAIERTLQRLPTLPIWLQEQQARPQPPALGERGALWPRAVTFLIACGIAAPLSYYFAVVTSRPHEQPVEVAAVMPPTDPSVSEPPAQHPPETRAGPESTSRQGALRLVAPTLSKSPPATTGVAERNARFSPPPDRAWVPATQTSNFKDVELLIDRGKQFFEAGDLIAARILFLRAANTGDAAAAVAMGETYDPIVLADRGVLGIAADLAKARSWYERAKEMGSPEGPRRLEMLANR